MMPSDEILKILEMVREKKISPEEAAELIAAVERASGHGTGREASWQGPSPSGLGHEIREQVLRSLEGVFGDRSRWKEAMRGEMLRGQGARPDRPTETVALTELPAGQDHVYVKVDVASAGLSFHAHPGRHIVFRYSGPTQGRPEVSYKGDRLEVEQSFSLHTLFSGWRTWEGPSIEILVPEGIHVLGSTDLQNGRLDIRGLSLRNFEGETLNGTIAFAGPWAERVSLETRNGTITVAAEAASTLSVEATNGKIDVAGRLEDASLETVNGRVFVQPFQGSRGSLQVETVRGAIKTRLPKGTGFVLDARSTLGSMDVRLEGLSRHEGQLGQSLHLERGDHALRIALETQVGAITVEESPT